MSTDTTAPDEQRYWLRWNTHQPHLVNLFKELRQSGALSDVLLTTSDGSVKCHRILLAASSVYFKNLFFGQSVNLSSYPIVALHNIRMCDLNLVLDFIYNGEIYLTDSTLAGFIQAAGNLQLNAIVESRMKQTFETGTSVGPQNIALSRVSESSSNDKQSKNLNRSSTSPGSGDNNKKRYSRQRISSSASFSGRLPWPLDKDQDLQPQSTHTDEIPQKDVIPLEKKKSCESGVQKRKEHPKSEEYMVPKSNLNVLVKSPIKKLAISKGPDRKSKVKSEASNSNTYKNYDHKQFEKAVKAVVHDNISCVKAAKIYGIPSRTLYFQKKRELGKQSLIAAKSNNNHPYTGTESDSRTSTNKKSEIKIAEDLYEPTLESDNNSGTCTRSDINSKNHLKDHNDGIIDDLFSNAQTQEVRTQRNPDCNETVKNDRPHATNTKRTPPLLTRVANNLIRENTPNGSYISDSDEFDDFQPHGSKAFKPNC